MKSFVKSYLPILILALGLVACNKPAGKSDKDAKDEPKANSASGQKIAYIDSDQITANMEEYKAAKNQLDSIRNTMMKQMEVEQTRAQQYYAAVMSKVQQGSLAPAQQKVEEEKLMKMQEDLQRKGAQLEQSLMTKEQELTKPLLDKIDEAIKTMAKENGYTYVFEKKMMLYSEGGEDATPKLKEKLNIK